MKRKRKQQRGRRIIPPDSIGGVGLFNTLINKLPFEAHLPGYRFCGPGTNLPKRLARGDIGINPLDQACKEHDIAYSKSNALEDRHEADNTLRASAQKRIHAPDASWKERLAARGVSAAMTGKIRFGLGLPPRSRIMKGGGMQLYPWRPAPPWFMQKPIRGSGWITRSKKKRRSKISRRKR